MAEQQYDFEEIRCFNDADVPEKLWPLIDRPEIEAFVKYAFPDVNMDMMRAQIKSMHTIKEFQIGVIAKFVMGLAKKTCDSLELRGVENINHEHAALYITNHRDIVLDSAFLCSLLATNNLETAEIAIGDNLLAYDWIKDLVRLNKSFIVMRSVPVRQMLEVSKRLSAYIHYTINEKKNPVWIAQREGRSKDSSDNTQASVLKMLALGGPSRDIIQNLRKLNMQPVALSYEFDPCDYLKAQEFQLKRDNAEWKKTKQDDLLSMSTGMTGYKGRVVFTIAPELNPIFDKYPWINDRNAQVNCVCELTDKSIHGNMVLFPVNYIAYELKYQSDKYSDKYDAAEKERVLKYLNGQLAKINIPNRDEEFLWDKILTMYSNPVINYEKATTKESNEGTPLT